MKESQNLAKPMSPAHPVGDLIAGPVLFRLQVEDLPGDAKDGAEVSAEDSVEDGAADSAIEKDIGVAEGPGAVKVIGPDVDITRRLAEYSGLSRSAIKLAMQCGAVWLQRHDDGRAHKPRRVRRKSASVRPGDIIFFYYDHTYLQRSAQPPRLLDDRGQFSVWVKPSGVRVYGSKWGDHLSLLRGVELACPGRNSFLVHRLDQWTSGLIAIAQGIFQHFGMTKVQEKVFLNLHL